VHRARHELVAALVGNSDHRRVNAENVHDRRGDCRERFLEGEALGEGTRDLVQRVHLTRALPLRLEHLAERFAQLLRTLVQPRVLHRDRKLSGERGEEHGIALADRARAGIDDEETDRFVLHVKRDRDGRALPCRLECRTGRRKRRIAVPGTCVDCRACAQRA